MRLIPNPADRDDLVQDVWIVAMTRIRRGELRAPELLLAFLVGTARALAVNERRRCIRRATVPNSSAVEEYPDDSGEPSEAAEHAQRRQLAVRAISSLRTKAYREVLLRSVANCDKSTTCADLDINAVQYSRLYYKAKDRLREVIRESIKPPYPPRRDPHRPRAARTRRTRNDSYAVCDTRRAVSARAIERTISACQQFGVKTIESFTIG
jgi:RNA polymerase sigma factor (sigma-70 family)